MTGLLVNDANRLTISRSYRDAVRSSIHKLRNLRPDEWPTQIASIEGKIAHIARYNPGPAARLRRYLSSVTDCDWLQQCGTENRQLWPHEERAPIDAEQRERC